MIKIADFGLTEDVYTKTYFRQQNHASVKLPVKWMAIESLQEGVFNEKSDVVSLGVASYLYYLSTFVLHPVVIWGDLLGNLQRWKEPLPRNHSSAGGGDIGARAENEAS